MNKNHELNGNESALLNEIAQSEDARQADEFVGPPAPPATVKEEEANEGFTPSEIQAKDEERKAECSAEADKLLVKMKAAIIRVEGEVAKTYLHVAGDSIKFVSLKMEAGHGFNAASEMVRLTFLTTCGVDLNIDKAQRAYVAWNLYCASQDMDDKARDKTARSVSWRTWYHVLSSLVSAKWNGKESVSFAFIPHVQAECLELMTGCIKERWSTDDVQDKAREIRAKSAQKVKEESEEKASEERKVKEEAERLAAEARKAKEEADKEERVKAEQAKQADKEAQEAQERLKSADETIAEEEGAENDPAAIEERAAIEQEAKDAQLKAQKAKEEQEAARQAKEKAESARKAQEKVAKDAADALKTHEKTAQKADATLKKVSEAQERSDDRKSGTPRKEDKGQTALNLAQTAAPADLAAHVFALISTAKMPSTVFAALVDLLDKEGLKLFKADAKAQKAIKALVLAYHDEA